MRAVFYKSVLDGRVSCQKGSFENTGIRDHSADVVVVAQVTVYVYDLTSTSTQRLFLSFSGLSLVFGLWRCGDGVFSDPQAWRYRGVDMEFGRPVSGLMPRPSQAVNKC